MPDVCNPLKLTCKHFSVFEDFRPIMESGVPELAIPPVDPMVVDKIAFNFWNVTAEFLNTTLRGFKQFSTRYSRIDKDKSYV